MAILPPGATIGIVGGGQLARMGAMAAAQLGLHVHIYTSEEDSPAQEVARQTTTSAYDDEEALRDFTSSFDVITVEFENIPAHTAEFLARLVPFYPSPELFAICRHREKEKAFIRQCSVQTAEYRVADTYEAFADAVQAVGLPCIAKHTTMGYDGKGQVRLSELADCTTAWDVLGGRQVIVEAFVPFVSEASVIVARDQQGAIMTFPVTRNIHTEGILSQSDAPAGLPGAVTARVEDIGRTLAEQGGLIGLLAVECFILEDGEVLVNELAPRPHNSGHWTMDGCSVSQFEQWMRIVAGWPMREPVLRHPTTMHNLIGEEALTLERWQQDSNAIIHLYGKHDCRPGRKMGHVNIITV